MLTTSLYGGYFKRLYIERKIRPSSTIKVLGYPYELNILPQDVYRPHPSDSRELLQRKLPDVKFTPKKETLETSFGRGDIFVSFNSTALVEAALRGKLCIQLKSFPIPTDDFEQLGICPKSFDTIEEIEGYLKEIAKVSDLKQFYRPVNPEYIEIPEPDPGTKFLELIQDII